MEQSHTPASADHPSQGGKFRPLLMALTGGLVVGLLIITALVAWTLLRGQEVSDTLLLILAVEDNTGVAVPGVIASLEKRGDDLQVTYVDPRDEVVVAGTTGTELRDAFAFGGADALADTWMFNTAVESSDWILLGTEQWDAIAGSIRIEIDAPRRLDALSSGELYTFNEGVNLVPATQIPQLLDAVSYLESADRIDVGTQVGEELLALLSGREIVFEDTSLDESGLQLWTDAISASYR